MVELGGGLLVMSREAADHWMGVPVDVAWAEFVEKPVGRCPHCHGELTTWDRMCWSGAAVTCPYYRCGESFEWAEV